jgi:dTDP-4-amino-4,6-dideoxygalactose transaminase
LKAQYSLIRHEVDEAIARVLERGEFILGEEVTAFEQEFAPYCGVSHAVGVSSGTAALHLALLACGIGRGDEVITVPFTSVATVAAIESTGGRAVLVDIDPARYTLDPERLASAITPQTRAVIPVHLYGCPADLAPILEIARHNNLFVIEDCAQAHGALYRGKKVSSWGDISAFSFYPTKNLGAYGDGGAVVTDNPALAERVRLLRQYGWETRQVSSIKGLNNRLDDLQAAILRVKLKYLDEWNTRRQELAGYYTDLLSGNAITLPVQPQDAVHVYHHYVVRHANRDSLQTFLADRGIRSLIHYPLPIHLQPAYEDLGYQPGDLPASELAARQVLSLPLYPEITKTSVEAVCRGILDFLRG